MESKEGVLVSILRFASGDCTNKGLSSKNSNLILVGEGISKKFTTEGKEDFLVLNEFNFRGEITLRAIPKSLINSGKHYMFGGNYCQCSISNGNITDQPIKIFDRVESKEEYLSND